MDEFKEALEDKIFILGLINLVCIFALLSHNWWTILFLNLGFIIGIVENLVGNKYDY